MWFYLHWKGQDAQYAHDGKKGIYRILPVGKNYVTVWEQTRARLLGTSAQGAKSPQLSLLHMAPGIADSYQPWNGWAKGDSSPLATSCDRCRDTSRGWNTHSPHDELWSVGAGCKFHSRERFGACFEVISRLEEHYWEIKIKTTNTKYTL